MKIIALEGIDGSGKSTLALALKKALNKLGYSVHLQHFPNYHGKTGKIIKEILCGNDPIDETLLRLLFAADRRETSASWKDLNVDFIVLDRYTTSGLIYGQAKRFPTSWLLALDTFAVATTHEFVLDIPINDAIERIMKRNQSGDQYDIDYELLIDCKDFYAALSHSCCLDALNSVENNVELILERILEI